MCVCVLAMDFEFILKVAERRIKAALGKAEAGKVLFTHWQQSKSRTLTCTVACFTSTENHSSNLRNYITTFINAIYPNTAVVLTYFHIHFFIHE